MLTRELGVILGKFAPVDFEVAVSTKKGVLRK